MENLALEPMLRDFLLGSIWICLMLGLCQGADVVKFLDWYRHRTISRDSRKLERKRRKFALRAAKLAERKAARLGK